MAPRTLILESPDGNHRVDVLDGGRVTIGERTLHVRPSVDGAMVVDDGPVRVWGAVAGDTCWIFLDGQLYEFEIGRGQPVAVRSRGSHGSLTAPMPATVRWIAVKAGDRVKRGETLILLEAMKMELPVRAAADGVVRAVRCREGELVQPDVPLIDIDE